MKLFDELMAETRSRANKKIEAINRQVTSFEELCHNLQTKMAAVNLTAEAVAPGSQVDQKAGERVLGAMSDGLRRFYVVRCKMIDELNAECKKAHHSLAQQLLDESMDGDKAKQIEAAIEEYNKLHEQATLTDKMFWRAMSDEFPGAEADGTCVLGVRSGWLAVTTPARETFEVTIGPPIVVSAQLAEALAGMAEEAAKKFGRQKSRRKATAAK